MKAAKILTSIEDVLKYLDAVAISYNATYKRKICNRKSTLMRTTKLFTMEIIKKHLLLHRKIEILTLC